MEKHGCSLLQHAVKRPQKTKVWTTDKNCTRTGDKSYVYACGCDRFYVAMRGDKEATVAGCKLPTLIHVTFTQPVQFCIQDEVV
jgi:hypothetical protein